MSKEQIDKAAIEEFFNDNPNVFTSVLRNMKGKTKKSYKKLPSINQTRKKNRDYKKKKKLSPIKEDEDEKEKVCFDCLQSGGKRKTKRKSLDKRRKTNKIKSRGAGGPFSSIFSKKTPDTFGREGSAVRDPTEEEEYPFEDPHRWRFDPRKYAEPKWESDEQRFVRLDNRDREFGHGPYINSKNEIVPAPSKRHYATQANIDLAKAYMKNKDEIKHKKNIEHNKHVVTNPLHQYKK